MLQLDAAAVTAATPYERLIAALEHAFVEGWTAPTRHSHVIPTAGEREATMLLMPAWRADRFAGLKVVNVFPANAQRGAPAVTSIYMLFDGRTGYPLALLDGETLTARRTAAASALAAAHLARADAKKLLIVGAGRMAAELPLAHATVRPISQIRIWNRSPTRAAKVASTLGDRGFEVELTDDLAAAAGWADIISCATLATRPLIHGAWLKPGVHLDLVGAFRPHMREVDAEAVSRSLVVVDTIDGAKAEAGDLLQAAREGKFDLSCIAGDLSDLCRRRLGRETSESITLFKSVGTAVEDLAAAAIAFDHYR